MNTDVEVDWKKTFNELALLEEFCQAAAEKLQEAITQEALDALMQNMGEIQQKYGALDHGSLLKVKKNGPETLGYETSSKIYLKFVESADYNTGIIAPFMNAASSGRFMPENSDVHAIRNLAEKYGLKNIQSLLPS